MHKSPRSACSRPEPRSDTQCDVVERPSGGGGSGLPPNAGWRSAVFAAMRAGYRRQVPPARRSHGLGMTNVAAVCREGDIVAADSLIVAKVLSALIHIKGVG